MVTLECRSFLFFFSLVICYFLTLVPFMIEESELKASYTGLIFEKGVGKGGHRFMKIENQTRTSNSI